MQKLYTGLASRRFLFLYCLIKIRFGFQAKYYIITHRWFISNDILINYKFYGPNQMLECMCLFVCLLIYHFWRFSTDQSIRICVWRKGLRREGEKKWGENNPIEMKWNVSQCRLITLGITRTTNECNFFYLCPLCVYITRRDAAHFHLVVRGPSAFIFIIKRTTVDDVIIKCADCLFICLVFFLFLGVCVHLVDYIQCAMWFVLMNSKVR